MEIENFGVVSLNENDLGGLSVKSTFCLLLHEVSTNPKTIEGSFVFDAPNGVELEVTIKRT